MKDLTLSGAIAGICATLVLDMLSLLASLFSIPHQTAIIVAADVFLSDHFSLAHPLPWIIGFLSHLVIGMWGGIVFAVFRHKTGVEYSLWKGAIYGTGLWLVNVGFLMPLLKVGVQVQKDPITIIFAFLSLLFYGMAVAFFIPYFLGSGKDPR